MLVPIAEALTRVLAATGGPLPPETVPVAAALHRTLAEDVHAQSDVPPFANSAMDGFAVQAGPAGRRLRITGESRAGHPGATEVTADSAVRISTGAALPPGATAVARVEDTSEEDGHVTIHAETPAEANIRRPGEDLTKGARILAPGTLLGPAELGAAVAAGAGRIACTTRPAVAVLCTGDELRAPGAVLGPGEIHNTNAVTLAALATAVGAHALEPVRVRDRPDATEHAIRQGLETADVVVISGGVSVGPHDHVKPALERLGVRPVFWGVALQPGKPTWFGTTEDGKLVFGLPGNPVSAYVTFVLFAAPALRKLLGQDPGEKHPTAALAEPVPRLEGREKAIRVTLETSEDGTTRARPTGPQGSHILSSLVGAEALALIRAGDGNADTGEQVPLVRL